MDSITNFIILHKSYAPGITFVLVLLAGFNLPISIDVIMVLSAFIAATLVPEQTIPLYLSMVIGSYFSAWICYWMGRTVGRKLLKIRYFQKLLPQERLEKVSAFYEKHGLLTLLIGRFIPLGVRNCIFMTTGMSRANFGKFMWRDAIACPLWATTLFFLCFELGHSYEILIRKVKILNLFIFLAFGVTVIGVIWYKKYKTLVKMRKASSSNCDAKPSE